MTHTTHLSDRMPAVAHGRDAWTAEDQHHLAVCQDCGDEWRLVRAARELGREVEAQLDPEAVASAVAGRLRDAPRPAAVRLPARRWGAAAAIAAAAVVALWFGPFRPGSGSDEGPVVQEALLPELEELSVDELERLLEVVPVPTGDASLGEIPNLDDLTEDDLRGVLRSLEG